MQIYSYVWFSPLSFFIENVQIYANSGNVLLKPNFYFYIIFYVLKRKFMQLNQSRVISGISC
jgi:hypothetical protein